MTDASIAAELLLVLLLIVMNGVFAMSEMAIVSARKARLQARADEGDAGARCALDMADHPNRFLSTVQVGITLIGILAGAYGGATIAAQLGDYLARIPAVAAYSGQLALGLVVAAITYLTLILGELAPKRIALIHPERIAARVARPMHYVSIAARPLVHVLGVSTDGVLRLLGIRKAEGPPVTEEEVATLIEQGTEAGIFEEEEQELVGRVFWLGDQRAYTLMVPRHRVVWLDVRDPPELNREKMILHRYSRFPVCDGGIDHVLGVVEVKDLWARVVGGEPLDLRAALREPLFVPERMRALRLLELFRESGVHYAIVVDEYGGTEGLVTLNDVLEEIAGDLTVPAEPRIVRRDDGSWLVDATLTMDEFWKALGLTERRGAERRRYNTLGGFVITRLGRIPVAGAAFEAFGFRFEVVDMDGRRVDKVLVTAVPGAAGAEAA
ncbi:MAG TPA: hemolysin family protein [Longimicrobiales bacterium]